MHAQSAPDTRNAPIAFWRIAESFLNVLYCLFGAPEDVAAQHTLTSKSHALLTSWLRAGEAMLRRLLMIEAAAVAAPARNAHGERPREASRLAADESASPPFVDDPKSWPVAFRCILDRRRLVGGGAGGPRKHVRFRSAWPLAQRYEAMLRVFNAPHAYAKRLARRLRESPSLAAVVLRAPPEYGHRVDRAEEITNAARCAWPPPDSS